MFTHDHIVRLASSLEYRLQAVSEQVHVIQLNEQIVQNTIILREPQHSPNLTVRGSTGYGDSNGGVRLTG